ncbi:MAG TPA: deoxynucleoside kinase [Candidatus Absconditabacterales bacterium]|nr:deoxynucleoside kinase [Candidatus Absconditabacterales bacterium]
MEKLKYIVVEGIHGSGKSSVAKEIAKILQEKGLPAKYLHFPDEESDLGKVIRGVLADKDLYKNREVLGLLYAAASNSFHIKSKNDEHIYVLERDAVTTGLIFQKDIPRNTRMEIYKFGIENLRKLGKVIYVKVDKDVARERIVARNNELAKSDDQVRKDKAGDKFIEKFDEMSFLYETQLMPQLEKLGLSFDVIENNTTIEEAGQKAIDALQDII